MKDRSCPTTKKRTRLLGRAKSVARSWGQLGDLSMMTGDAGMPPKTDAMTAVQWTGSMDAEGFPPDAAWETVPGVQFDWDWQGTKADPTRETQVRLLWTPE